MESVTTLPWGRPLTRDDLDAMPDDGHRYELVDGALLVTPAPSARHQTGVGQLYVLLRAALAGSDLRVLFAPFEVRLAHDTVVQPDLLVASRADFTERNLPVAPLLAVEVLSPSTQRIDRFLKHSRYAAAGVEHYWVVDPIEPNLTAWRLNAGLGTYEEAGHAAGAEAFHATEPVTVTIVPAELVTD